MRSSAMVMSHPKQRRETTVDRRWRRRRASKAVTAIGENDSARRVNWERGTPITTPPRSLAELFLGFLSVGARSFGGVLPAAHYVMVERRHWLTPADFTETIGLCQALPGPNVGNAAIVLGKRWFGLRGAIVAFLGLFALPYLWVLALALVYTHWATRPLVSAVVTGVGASAAGLLVAPAVKLGRPIARKPAAVALMAGCLVAGALGRVPLPLVVPIAVSGGIALSPGRLLRS